jgi:pyrroloquinoline quinone biosynthesis protein B
VLTSADLDQCLGLLVLRELQPIQILAAASIRRILREDNSMFSMLQRTEDQAHWHDITPGTAFKLFPEVSRQSPVECLPLALATHCQLCHRKRSPGEAKGLICMRNRAKRLAFPWLEINQALPIILIPWMLLPMELLER